MKSLKLIYAAAIIIIIALTLSAGCIMVPRAEDVRTSAQSFLKSRYKKSFEIIKVKSTVNEGNMNFKGFMIHAAPVDNPDMVFAFNADYRKKKLLVKEDVFEKTYQNASTRLELSNSLIELLHRQLDDVMVEVKPDLGKNASIDIFLFKQLTDENKMDYMVSIRRAMTDLFPDLAGYEKLIVEIRFFSENAWHPANTKIIDHYVRIPKKHKRWWRSYVYSLRIDIAKMENKFVFPDAAKLFGRLIFNTASSTGLKAKKDAGKKLSEYLSNAWKARYRVNKYRTTDFTTNAVNLINFRFRACPKKYSFMNCPKNEMRRVYCKYNLDTGAIQVRELPAGEKW
ncbi:hypothetical protein QUF76_07560 [Desulfobacterales bacterium HSG16]|nr:hypothetical protein [Desulfobacterales bacterium HSG16]